MRLGLRRELMLFSSVVDFGQVRERPITSFASRGGSEYSFALFFFFWFLRKQHLWFYELWLKEKNR